MRPASHAAVVKLISAFIVLLVLFGLEGFSFAQARLSRSDVRARSLVRKHAGATPARTAGVRAIQPPNTTDSWTGGGDGTSWNNASNWSAGVPNSSTVDVTIGTTTAAVNDNITASVGNLTLSHSGDSLTLANGITLSVFGSTISNAGTITLGGTNFGTNLILQGNVTLSGGGTLVLGNSTANNIQGTSGSVTLTNQETISGGGQIGNGLLTLVNSGTINANQPTVLTIQDATGAGATNTGTLEATAGGTLKLFNTTFTNTGGTVSANTGTLQVNSSTINGGNVTLAGASTLQLNTGTIHGGSTLTNSATGTIEVASGTNTLGGTINNSAGGAFKIDNGAVLDLEAGTYSQLGAVQLNGTNFGTFLVLTGNATLSGGSITLGNSTANNIQGTSGSVTLTNQETISGGGQIGNGLLTLVNSGTINANQPTVLTIQDATGAGATNTGTLEATAGGTLKLFNTTFTNTGGTVSANAGTLQVNSSTINGGNVTLAGASTLQLNTGTIHGGSTLTNSATGTIEVASGTNTLGGTINNSAGGTFKIDNGAILDLEAGTYSQLGAVQLNGTNFGTFLVLTGNATLSGGSITLGNSTANNIQGTSGSVTLTNQETISGGGQIGNGLLTLVNSGTINANQPTVLTIQDATGAGATNTGTLEATAGGTLKLFNTTFTNTGGTVSANAGTLQVNSSTINGGNVTLAGASTLQLNTGTIHGGSTLTNSATGTIEVASGTNTLGGTINNSAGGAFKIDNGAVLDLEAGTYSQLGAVQLNGTNFGTFLVLTGNATLSGGSITLGNSTANNIQGTAAAVTLTNQETISGAGQIGNGLLTLVNSGTINANQTTPLTIQDGVNLTATNTGTLEATAGGTLKLNSTTFTNTGGTVSANVGTLQLNSSTINGGNVTLAGASTLQLNTGTIHGGSTLTNSATGTIEVASGTNTLGGTINNSAGGAFKIDNGAILDLEAGTYSQLGAVQLNGTNFGTYLVLQGNVTLTGGSITLGNSTANNIQGGLPAYVLTNQETISGAGQIGNGLLTLVNSGTINANQTTALTIQDGSTAATNTGTLEATAGGTLKLNSTTFTNTGGTVSANAGTLQLNSSTINGGNVTLTGASTLQLNTGTIHGGSTLTNSATGTIEVASGTNTLGGTINNSAGGAFKIDNGAILDLEAGTYSQLGAVQLNGTNFGTSLVLEGNVTLSGGTVTLSNSTNNSIFGAVGTDVLTNQETIQGAGHIGNGQMGLVNSGTIIANQSTPLIIQPSASGFSNTGTLQVSSGDTMQVTGGPFTNFSGSTLTGGTYNVSGTLKIDQLGSAGGEIVTNAAKIILNGTGSTIVDSASKNALTNLSSNTAAGAFTVSGGQTFTTVGNFSNLGSLTVGTGSSFTVAGTLAQISGSTLLGGTFVLGGNLNVASGINITTNSSTLTLSGGTIESGATNALSALASNSKSLTIGGSSNNVSTSAATFSDAGLLTVNAGDSFNATALSQLTGPNGSKTLAAGTYVLAGNLNLSTSGISVTTNSATLTLQGGTITSGGSGNNALAALASNTKSLTIAGTGTNISTTAATFSNTGVLTINSGDSFTAPALTQISGTTLSGGTFVLGGNLILTAAANITTNSAVLTLQGGSIKTGTTNDLANLSSNTNSLTLAGNASFATVGSFTNSGALTVNKGSKFTVASGTLTNLASGTLSGGTFTIGGTLQLPSGNGGITTNAANLTLSAPAAKILDGTSNALAGFNNNTGTFALSGGASLTSAASNFTNSGTVAVAKGSTFTVPGTGNLYSQTAGQTTVDGTLTGINGGVFATGGTIQGAGTVNGNVSAGNASGNAVTINVGDSGKAGLLSITGTYAQLATGNMTGLINGSTAGTGYSQLKVTGTAALAGTINFTVAAAFQSSLTLGETFTALTASSLAGTFSNSTIAINSTFHFTVSYTTTGVVLTVASGPVGASSTSPVPSMAMVSAKPVMTSKSSLARSKTPIVTSGLHVLSGASKASRIVVASWGKPVARPGTIVAHGSELRSSARIWERMPLVTSSPVRTVAVATPSRPLTIVSTRANVPASTSALRMGQSPSIGVQGLRMPRIGLVESRHLPVKTLSPMSLRIGR